MYGHSGTDKSSRCEHFAGIDENRVNPNTQSCQECEIEDTDWVALRMCLTCGHVGYCDSSEGLHASKHFEQTGVEMVLCSVIHEWIATWSIECSWQYYSVQNICEHVV